MITTKSHEIRLWSVESVLGSLIVSMSPEVFYIYTNSTLQKSSSSRISSSLSYLRSISPSTHHLRAFPKLLFPNSLSQVQSCHTVFLSFFDPSQSWHRLLFPNHHGVTLLCSNCEQTLISNIRSSLMPIPKTSQIFLLRLTPQPNAGFRMVGGRLDWTS